MTIERPDMALKLDGTDERISIIIVHNDNPDYLNICIQTILVCSINNNYEIIVVDNGSQEVKTQAYLDDLANDGIKVIRNDSNIYWAKAANQGARAADKNSKYLVFLHHDLNILSPIWMDVLINISEKNKSGVVGYYMESYTVPGSSQRFDFVQESCMMVSRECWNDCGPFIEDLPQIGAPFIFNLTAASKGYAPQIIDNKENKFVWHYKITALDFSDLERLNDEASSRLPKFLMQLQK